jgi:hypothetical protein
MTSIAPVPSPVVVDGLVSDEKLRQLVALEAEYPELDFKRMLDLNDRCALVELAKDVGAMQVRGGYIVVGVDDNGKLTGELEASQKKLFDEANLVPKLVRYLPEPLEMRTRWFELDENNTVLIYVGPNPDGCAVFRVDGTCNENRNERVIFRQFDIFWRDGTRSVRVNQEGIREVFRRRLDRERAVWAVEHQQQLRADFENLRQAYASRAVSEAPIGALGLDLDPGTLASAALEAVRRDDTIPLRRLLSDARRRARELYSEGNEIGPDLEDLLDRLTCLAATFLEYEVNPWFERTLEALVDVYDLGLDQSGRSLDYSFAIDPADARTRLWLVVVERAYALGALAVRLERWDAVRQITLERPDHLSEYYHSWLRHGLTMASRARHLESQDEGGGSIRLSLLNLARQQVLRLACLRADGVRADDDELLDSLAQFDLLQALVAIANARSVSTGVFYTNFAAFRPDRVEPAVERLIRDREMRKMIFPLTDTDLALALNKLNEMASREGVATGFFGFQAEPIVRFINEHQPATPGQTALTEDDLR